MTDEVNAASTSVRDEVGRSRFSVFDSLLLFVGSLSLYVLLAQRTMYGPDGWRLLRRIDSEDFRDNLHVLYKPMAIGAKRLGDSWLGLQVYDAVVLLSAVGTALGVLFWHRAFVVLGLGRGRSSLAAVLCAVSPGPVFFATVVELHGPFIAFAGFAAWVASGLVRRPGLLRAAATGVAIACAYAAHSSGAFLVTGLVVPVLAEAKRRGAGWGRCLIALLVASVVGAAGSLGARMIAEQAGTLSDPGRSFEFFRLYAEAHLSKPALIPGAIWNEVLVPFLPAIVTAFALARGFTLLGLVVAASVYALLGWVLLGDFDERGAYSLPLVFPIAWVVAQRLRLGACIGLLALALVVSVALVRDHDRRPTVGQAEALRSLDVAGEVPFLLVAGIDDFSLRFIEFPDLEPLDDYFDLLDLALSDPSDVAGQLPLLSQVLQLKANGRPIVLLDSSLEQLEKEVPDGQFDRPTAGPLLLAELRRTFEFQRLDENRLHGHRLVSK